MRLLNNITISIFIGIIFIGSIVTILLYINQRQSTLKTNDIEVALPEERLISIQQQIQDIKNAEKRREGYNSYDKPFDDRDYSYDERTADFRLVCTTPCPVSKDILDQEFAAIAYAVSTLRGLTQSDLDERLLPFEVHASEDIVCPFKENAGAYMTMFIDSNKYFRGLLCFFFEKGDYDRTKFPYSVSVHEVTHLFEYGKFPKNSILLEGLSEMMQSFFLKGSERDSFCWQGNSWYKQVAQNAHDPHYVGGDLFFELCNQYGFDYHDLPELFSQLEIRSGNVDEQEFVNIINNIVGTDTSHLFQQAGVI